MTINASDIKLLASERMADTSDGGGRRTSNVIPDGTPGNIFPKVSRLDSVYGRVNLRKVYGAVQTANLDIYAGAHVAIIDPPDNDKIHISMFSTNNDFDARDTARNRIESYVVAGPESRVLLYGKQLIGQSAILCYQRVEEALPEVGDVYCLSKEIGTSIVYQQFVRVTELTHEVRTFSDGQQEWQRRVMTMSISTPLRYEFVGVELPSQSSQPAREAKLRLTNIADAARYFGIRPVAEPAAQNALQVRVDSVYTPVVPTTQRETPLSNATPGGASLTQNSRSGVIRQLIRNHGGNIFAPGATLWRRPKNGTVKLYGGGTLFGQDDGKGSITNTPSSPSNMPLFASALTINYESGVISGSDSTNQTTNFSYIVEYEPVAELSGPAHTREVQITIGNRGTVYVETLNPLPGRGSLVIDYRALGKWYRMRDDGNGQISGDDESIGIGTIDYVTGAAVVTLGALPDADTSIIYTWASPIHATVTTNDAGNPYTSFVLPDLPVKTNTLAITFNRVGDVPVTTTVNSSGVISGTGVTGTLNRITGEVKLTFNGSYLPKAGAIFTANYQQVLPATPGMEVIATGSFTPTGTVTIPDVPITPGSLSFVTTLSGQVTTLGWNAWRASFSGTVTVSDDGNGNVFVPGGQQVPGTLVFGGIPPQAAVVSQNTNIGTINYQTGEVTFSAATVACTTQAYTSVYKGGGWSSATAQFTLTTNQTVNYVIEISGVSVSESSKTATFDLEDLGLKIDLTQTTGRIIAPGSVLFYLGGYMYLDRSGTLYGGILVRGDGAQQNYSTPVGTINYNTGVITLTDWNNSLTAQAADANGTYTGTTSTPGTTATMYSCLTIYGEFSVGDIFFRTAGSPIRSGSFYVQATTVDGELISGTSDSNGIITGAKVRGEVLQEVGVARVEFGETISNVFTPIGVVPSTIRYNSVVLSNLPLNAEILGLDPVRLPADGRVPIYRPADVVVIHNTKSYALPNPAVAGATYNVGRINLSELYLIDADGDKVATSKYVANLTAGTVTMAADLDLTGYTQPLTVRHRIEELNLLSDVQINGQLSLTGPLSRAYDADTYVSTALLFGDLYARATNLFDQGAWTGVWADQVTGSGATAQYNDIDYPVEVLNNGAVTERWRINFTTATAFQVIGENLGVIATGTTSADLTPTNPLTSLPYFTLRAAGWGLGWAAGNQLRFNTLGATAPIWIARTVLPGATLNGDSFDLQVRGDVDA